MADKVQIADSILVRDGRVLLVQHEKAIAYGQWGLPGGQVEPGETTEQAIIREVAEELAIPLDPATFVEVIAHDGAAPNEQHLHITTYLVPVSQKTFTVAAGELMGFGWFTLGELRNMGASLRSSWIIEMAERALQKV